jgi:hypothetical protein
MLPAHLDHNLATDSAQKCLACVYLETVVDHGKQCVCDHTRSYPPRPLNLLFSEPSILLSKPLS